MDIMKCKDCGTEVITRAHRCPNCGEPIEKQSGCDPCMGGIVILVLWLIFFGVIGSSLGQYSTEKGNDRPSLPHTNGAVRNEMEAKADYNAGAIASLTEQEKKNHAPTLSPNKKETEKPTLASTPAVEQEKAVIPRYSVLDEDVHEARGKTQVLLNILVSGEISKAQLMFLLDELYSSIRARKGFKYQNYPTNICIYAFTSKERAESGQWIAMLQKNYDDIKPAISINERQVMQLDSKVDKRLDLSDEDRKVIWEKLLSAEKRTWEEGEKQYPVDATQSPRLGQVLELSKDTLLMPELEPTDPVAAMHRVLRLPPRTTIKIIGLGMNRETLWYYVEATSASKRSTATGWINSIALMGLAPVDSRDKLETEKEQEELAKEYGLTNQELYEIYLEGMAKDWAFPKPRGESSVIIKGRSSRAQSSYDDVAREYEDQQNHAAYGVPSRVLKQIKERIASRYPGSYSTQEMLINSEVEAYREVKSYRDRSVPSTVLERIKATVAHHHPDSYSVQKTLVAAEVEAYKSIERYSDIRIPSRVLEGIKENVARRHPDSYSSQKTLLDADVEAYKWLQDYKDDRVPFWVLDRIKEKMGIHHPESYSLQKTLVEAEVEAYKQLQNYRDDRMPYSALRQIKQRIAKRHPGSYSLQKTLIDAEVETYLEAKRRW